MPGNKEKKQGCRAWAAKKKWQMLRPSVHIKADISLLLTNAKGSPL